MHHPSQAFTTCDHPKVIPTPGQTASFSAAQRPGIREFSPRNTWLPLPAKGQSSLRLLWQWHLSEVEGIDPSENMRETS